MKITALSLVLSTLLAFAQPASADHPAISITQAAEIAQKELVAKGVQDKVFIKSLSLERSTLLSTKPIWVVSWSGSVPSSREGRNEVGLEINMQGEVVHLVKGPGTGPKTSTKPR